MKKTGFTLAEVLISLTIIGVIAAITVPALIQNTQKQEIVSRLKKVYSSMSQAANMIIAENGSPKASEGGWASSNDNICLLFQKHMNNAKACQNKQLILTDGTKISFVTGSNGDFLTCTHKSGNPWTLNVCAEISADINGDAKPNKKGKDIFYFVLKESGIYPMSCDADYNLCKSPGFGCACIILREGAVNY